MAIGATPILEVEHVSVRFGERVVLRDVSFTVPAGTSLAIVGPNGSGKTVLFRALIGAIPYQGVIRWADGVRIGYVPQKLDIERDVPLTGLDFLRARAALDGVAASEVARILALVGLPEPLARQAIGALSGGEFQRLLVGFALIGHPTVLLLDEPTAGVDEPGQERLYDLAHRLQEERGLTVLLISHELSIVYRYATTVLCLGHGSVCLGPPQTILTPERLQQVYGTPVAFHVHDA
jgi:zinc transport system ATP-binding protein